MQVALLVALLSAAAFVAAAEEISSVQTVGQPQPQHIQGQLAPVVHSQSGPVGEQAHHAGAFEHHSNDGHPQDHPQHQRIVPAGVIQMVGPQQYSGAGSSATGMGPVGISGVQGASGEQYGKPESASIPPNYKPFGSWGLYIGGNPADGYYSNYYKALGSSVEKQQVSGAGEQTQAIGPVKPQVAAFTPSVRQASGIYATGGPAGGASYAEQVYPFDYYTTADLNSGSRVSMVEQMGGGPSSYAAGSSVLASPATIGAQVYNTAPMMAYGAPQDSAPMAYVDHYATKRAGASSSSSSAAGAKTQQPYEPHTKGSQQVRYAYVDHQQAPHYASSQAPGQVVAYPVPVGSQIVGSQPGTEGAYAPYGVLGYTRYAVKPTMVASSEQQYYHQGVHSAPSAHFPMYKQQQQQQHQPQHQHQQQQASAAGGAYQPMGFYGYPLNQLHYSQGSIVPASSGPSSSSSVASSGSSSPIVGVHEHQTAGNIMMVPAGTGMIEAAASEKSETIGEIKPATAKETQKSSA